MVARVFAILPLSCILQMPCEMVCQGGQDDALVECFRSVGGYSAFQNREFLFRANQLYLKKWCGTDSAISVVVPTIRRRHIEWDAVSQGRAKDQKIADMREY
jgi:hypothetical protein